MTEEIGRAYLSTAVNTRLDALTPTYDNRYQRIQLGETPINAKNQGVVGGNTGNQATALQAIHDGIVSAGKRRKIYLPPDQYRFTSGFTHNASYVSLESEGAELNFAGMSGGNAYTVTGTVDPPYKQATQGIAGIELVGPGSSSSVVGLNFETAGVSAAGPSHISVSRSSIHGFGTGVRHYSRSYVDNFFGVDIWNNGVGIDAPSGGLDYGERLTYVGSSVFNNGIAVRGHDAFFHMLGCSFDYNTVQFEITGAALFLVGCHVESARDLHSIAPIRLLDSGSMVSMSGGILAMTGTATPTAPTIVYSVASPLNGGGAFFRHVKMQGLRTTGGAFYEGSGAYVEECPLLDVGNTSMPGSELIVRTWFNQGVAASSVIDAKTSMRMISSGSNVTITASPSIDAGIDGKMIRIMNVGANNITLQDQATLPGSRFRLSASSITLGPRQSAEFVWLDLMGGNWCQVGPIQGFL